MNNASFHLYRILENVDYCIVKKIKSVLACIWGRLGEGCENPERFERELQRGIRKILGVDEG